MMYSTEEASVNCDECINEIISPHVEQEFVDVLLRILLPHQSQLIHLLG